MGFHGKQWRAQTFLPPLSMADLDNTLLPVISAVRRRGCHAHTHPLPSPHMHILHCILPTGNFASNRISRIFQNTARTFLFRAWVVTRPHHFFHLAIARCRHYTCISKCNKFSYAQIFMCWPHTQQKTGKFEPCHNFLLYGYTTMCRLSLSPGELWCPSTQATGFRPSLLGTFAADLVLRLPPISSAS